MSTSALSRGRLGRWQWVVESEWPAVWRPSKWNWTDFTFIQVKVERVRYLDRDGIKGWDIWIGAFGFVFGVSNCFGYAHDDNEDASPQGGEKRG